MARAEEVKKKKFRKAEPPLKTERLLQPLKTTTKEKRRRTIHGCGKAGGRKVKKGDEFGHKGDHS